MHVLEGKEDNVRPIAVDGLDQLPLDPHDPTKDLFDHAAEP